MKYREIMWATRKQDYAYEKENEKPFATWNFYGDGDKEDTTDKDSIILEPSTFPPGTKVTIEIPVCPKCKNDCECCSCGFDWTRWAQENCE